MALVSFIKENAPFLTAGAILTFCSSFGQTYFISIFAGEIRETFDLTHGGWGAIYTVATMTSAAVMVWAGTLTDVFRVRALGPIVLAMLGAACLLMALAPGIAVLGITIFLLRLFGQGMMMHIAFVAMARWFVKTRGRAVAVASMGFSFGEAVLPVTFVALLGLNDWRLLWVAAALIPFAMVPVIRNLLRLERTPQSIAAETPIAGMNGRFWTRGQSLRHYLFWLVSLAILGQGAFGTAFLFHQVHLAEIKGWNHIELVALFPFYTLTAVITSFVVGAAMDRVGAFRLIPFYMLPIAGFFFVVPHVETAFWMILPLLLFGILQGSAATLVTGFSAEAYGTQHIGSIRSAMTAVGVLGSAIGPGITGWLIDLGMNFERQMPWIGAYFLVVTVLLILGVGAARRHLDATPIEA